MTAPKRRWPRFSLRTMFVVVTVFGCWLGWNLQQVRERERFLREIPSRGGSFYALTGVPQYPPVKLRPISAPFVWSWLGATAVPADAISLPHDKFSRDEIERARRLFPEAGINQSTAPRSTP